MEDTNEKRLDEFVEKVVKSTGLEVPSDNFTQDVMAKLASHGAQSPVTVYQPLISKTSWFILAAITLLLFAYVIFGKFDLTISWLPNIDLVTINNIGFIETMSQFQLPNTVIYALIGITLFFYIQLIYLKKYLGSRVAIN